MNWMLEELRYWEIRQKIFSAKFVDILLGNNFLLCAMLPLIFRPYEEVFHVHVFVGLLVLNVYAF